ncbi:MAG: ATP-binding cassette domain-containing protein [Candidatus Marinimicrobia bacterium]|nr:ATP-binding cassette domain-containing protein [Candidatus Neomarinimicrobiota bacterium]MDP6853198.1 ATP-binding cassette domain-containing protein [Candidatus Neomarinimicrobiota bacterium]
MIQVNTVTKQFTGGRKLASPFAPPDKVIAVDKVSFECHPGKIFGLIGPNGAGKTTTLRMIATMLKPSAGNITVAGYDVEKSPLETRQKLGFLSCNTGLYDRLTAEEMVQYYADLYGMSKPHYTDRKNELFSLLDMHSFADRRISKLSTGMKQKVNIARTVIHNPDVVIFDEPTSGLDVLTSKNIVELIKRCKDEGKTIIFSTHRFGELKLLCDDIAIIHNGELFYNGSYSEFESNMKEDTLEEEFIRLTGETA